MKIYSYPAAKFETNITRFTLPIRALAFNPSGTVLAAAGQDEGIRLINVSDNKVTSSLKANDGFPVLSLAFDPQGEYLASAGADGTVHVWSISGGTIVETFKRIAPKVDESNLLRNCVCWRPDGSFLAIPGIVS